MFNQLLFTRDKNVFPEVFRDKEDIVCWVVICGALAWRENAVPPFDGMFGRIKIIGYLVCWWEKLEIILLWIVIESVWVIVV